MKSIFPIVSLLATTLAASSDLLTIRSTSISTYSSCSSSVPVLSSSRAYYGNNSIEANPGSASTKSKSVIYQYETDYGTDIVEATRTVCDSNNNCYVTTDLESKTTYTTTVNGILTVVTTQVPIDITSDSAPTTQAARPVITTENGIPQSTTEEEQKTTQAPVPQSSEIEQEASTTTLVITTCKDDKCSQFTETTGYKIYTSDETIYTTYCPLSTVTDSESTKSTAEAESELTKPSTKTTAGTITKGTINGEATTKNTPKASTATTPLSSAKPVTVHGTTVVTVTSCSNDICSQFPKTTGVQIVSEESTVYTTYCPLSDETSQSTTVPASSTPVTINVITNNIVTESPSLAIQSSQSTVDSQSSAAVSVPSINTTYEGVAAITTGFGGLLVSLFLMMI